MHFLDIMQHTRATCINVLRPVCTPCAMYRCREDVRRMRIRHYFELVQTRRFCRAVRHGICACAYTRTTACTQRRASNTRNARLVQMLKSRAEYERQKRFMCSKYGPANAINASKRFSFFYLLDLSNK